MFAVIRQRQAVQSSNPGDMASGRTFWPVWTPGDRSNSTKFSMLGGDFPPSWGATFGYRPPAVKPKRMSVERRSKGEKVYSLRQSRPAGKHSSMRTKGHRQEN